MICCVIEYEKLPLFLELAQLDAEGKNANIASHLGNKLQLKMPDNCFICI